MQKRAIFTLLLFSSSKLTAQEETLVDLDKTLFQADVVTNNSELFYEATKYYRLPVTQLRRGVDWWINNQLYNSSESPIEDYNITTNTHRLRLVGSTKEYNVGADLQLSSLTKHNWSLGTDLNFRSGRDANISGVFNQSFQGEFTVAKEFGRRHYIDLGLSLPITMEGLQGGASQEAITLTGDNLYNPAWGFYDGEIRNARVRRYRVPELNLRYQLPIVGSTVAAFIANVKVGRSSLSRLGWYNNYNPTPDYYRKLPSYISNSDIKADVEELWRNQNSDYTQIAWDNLVETNQRSSDGEANYTIEDQVERVARADATLLLSSRLGDGVRLTYGAKMDLDRGRHFKEMRDLLGADHLTDVDQYIGDNAHLSNDMQNNLQDPNRKISEGDRFGYDYTLSTSTTTGLLGLEYRSNSFVLELRGLFGESVIQRVGHYEKERFAAEQSYGGSNKVTLPASSARIYIGYSPMGRHSVSLSASTNKITPKAEDLFIQEQNANRVIESPTSQNINSIELGYRYSSPQFMIDIKGFFIQSRNQTNAWQSYDDLSYTYSDVVVSNIGYRSLGAEIVTTYKASKSLNLEMTLAAGDYTYDTTPIITLYDDSDMSLYSTSEANAVVGCKVGNAPQLVTTLGVTYFAENSFILSANCSYAGGRYIAPSFIRRSDRVIRGTGSPEIENEIVTQSNLNSVFDLTLGVTKSFWLVDDNRISLTIRANNMLGDRDRINYGRESNRVLRSSGSSDTGAYYLQSDTYYYGSPRTYYISCNYIF